MPAPDVLIIGGGVNGVALLRDLALNGVAAVLVDQDDFCGGASSASSRMAHGGLRYLEGREFRLVSEAARERNMLLHDARHLVQPLEIVVPLEYWLRGVGRAVLRFLGLSRRPGPLSLVALQAALTLYERFGAVRRALPHHRIWAATQIRELRLAVPARAVVSYFDGQILQPETLVLDMLDEALTCKDIVALNHACWQPSASGEVIVQDRLQDRHLRLKPRLIVNAAGAGIDAVNAALGLESHLVRGVKGAHLLLRNASLTQRMAGRAFYYDDGHGRMVICLPVGDCILMGTTEVETANPDDREVSEQEIGYLLSALRRLFTDISVTRDQIVAVTSGIRPLQAGGGSATQAARDHALVQAQVGELPVLSLVGGKWTTFRSIAEEAADRVLALLGRSRTASTAGRAFPMAPEGTVVRIAAECGLTKARAALLVARYGAAAMAVAHTCRTDDSPLPDLPQHFSAAEIGWLVRYRMAMRLEDLVLRRTGLVATGRLTSAGLRELAGAMAQALGQDAAWIEGEIALALADPRILGFHAKGGLP